MIYQPSPTAGQLFQGEILSNLVQARLDLACVASDATPIVIPVTHPFGVVLTQGCDLESDYLQRTGQRDRGSPIPSILFAEVHGVDALRAGAEIRSDIWKRVRQNKDERYHYLRGVPEDADAANQGTPDLAIDFKRYFTIPTDEVYRRLELGEIQRRACLQPPYREHLASRFFYYHYRVALPEDHFVQRTDT